MILRYYADSDVREWHDHTLRLFRTRCMIRTASLSRLTGSTSSTGRSRTSQAKYDPQRLRKVYERDLKRNRALNQTIDQTPSEAFKRYRKLDIAGNVAVVDDEGRSNGPQHCRGTLTAIGQGLRRRLRWTFWRISPPVQAIVSALSASLCWMATKPSVRTVAANFHSIRY